MVNETFKEIVQKGKEVLTRAGLLHAKFVEVEKVKCKKGISLFY